MAKWFTECCKCKKELIIELSPADAQTKVGQDMVCEDCQRAIYNNYNYMDW